MAQVVAVVVLLVLANHAGTTARDLSAQIDRHALADLAQSNPLEVCVNGADRLTESGKNWFEAVGPLELVPTFKWPNGSIADCVQIANPSLKINFLIGQHDNSLFEGHDNNTLLDELTLAAMYKCGMVTGHATDREFVNDIHNNAVAQRASYNHGAHAATNIVRQPLDLVLKNVTIDNQTFEVNWLAIKERHGKGNSFLGVLHGIPLLAHDPAVFPKNAQTPDPALA